MSFATYLRLDVPTFARNITVIRAARKMIDKKHLRDPAQRNTRKRFYKHMLEIHAASQCMMHQHRI